MYNLHLSAEQLEIRSTVRDFVAQEIKPWALKSERLEAMDRSLPLHLLDKASQLGLRTLALSEGAGGAGADTLAAAIVAEELAAGDPDVAAVLMETSRLGHLLFDQLMNEAQRERFLPGLIGDDRHHLAFAEPGDEALGIDYHRPTAPAPTVKTVARRTGAAEWIVNGTNACVANAPLAKLFAVAVAAEPAAEKSANLRILLVPRDTPGLTVTAHDGPDRWFHGACGAVTFAECRVPAQYAIEGERAAAARHDDGRAQAIAAAINLGIGRAACEAALDYAQLRVQGGRRIVEHQAIGTKLAEIAIRLNVARNAVWQAAWAADHPEAQADLSVPDLPLATIARVFTAEAVHRAAKDAAECFGAMGVMRDMPLQKYVRDALISLHAGGRASDAKLGIAEALAGYRRAPPATMQAAE